MTVRTDHTMRCDVPQCTTRPKKLTYAADLPSGWSRGRMSIIGPWTGTPTTLPAHFCPQHRHLRWHLLDPKGEDS